MSNVYINGEYISEEHAAIPIMDRGFLFGDGVFTTLKVEEGMVHNLPQHLKRISSQCEHLNIRPPVIRKDVFTQMVERNNAQKGLWRMKIIVTGGSISDLSLPCRQHGTVLITMSEVHQTLTTPVKIVVYPHSVMSPISQLKTLSYLERLQVKQYAVEEGADDAMVLLLGQYLLETSFSNIFWIKGNVFFTPKSTLPLLRGITLQKHIEAAIDQGMSLQEGYYKLEDIPENAFVYLCNSINENRPVKSIANRQFPVFISK